MTTRMKLPPNEILFFIENIPIVALQENYEEKYVAVFLSRKVITEIIACCN